MRISSLLIASVMSAVLLAGGCAKKETPAEHAVDKTKDALNMREHEKLKDAGEDAKKAADEAADGVKDAAHGD
jgi:hypothetical protein